MKEFMYAEYNMAALAIRSFLRFIEWLYFKIHRFVGRFAPIVSDLFVF